MIKQLILLTAFYISYKNDVKIFLIYFINNFPKNIHKHNPLFYLFFIRLERKKLVKSFFDLDFRVLISYSQVSTKKKKKNPNYQIIDKKK